MGVMALLGWIKTTLRAEIRGKDMAKGFRGKYNDLKYFGVDIPYVLHMDGLSLESAGIELEFLRKCHYFCRRIPSKNVNTPDFPKTYSIWKRRSDELHHITRFDYGNAHGWLVRIYHNRQASRKLFSDGVHGDIEEALQEAQRWRDSVLSDKINSRTNPATGKPLHFRRVKYKNNKSGVNGVFFSYNTSKDKTRRYPCVVLNWCDDAGPHMKRISYSHDEGGDRARAFGEAVALRKEKELELEGVLK